MARVQLDPSEYVDIIRKISPLREKLNILSKSLKNVSESFPAEKGSYCEIDMDNLNEIEFIINNEIIKPIKDKFKKNS